MRAVSMLAVASCCTSVLVAAPAARAQGTPPPTGTTSSSPPEASPSTPPTVPPIETPAATPPPPPAPPAPSTPSAVEKVAAAAASLVRIYGTLKPTVIVSVGGVESFSQPNASAATAAGNPVLATLPKETRGTFQVAQSRFGMHIAEKSVARGQLEFDFVDFSKASPTVAALPRLRIAKVEWEPVEKLVFGFGQDWDLFGPINPYGSNLVGASFQAGNTGFMRQQIKAVYTAGNVAEIGAAIGLQGANATARDASIELARMPTGAVRAAALFGKSRIGIAGIATELRVAPATPAERRTGAYGGMIYADVEPFAALRFKGEAYVGRNLANTGALALAQVSPASGDLDEIGGFLSARLALAEAHAIYATGGFAQILNGDKVVPSYSVTPPAAPGGAPTAALSGAGPGIRWNIAARIGYELRPVKPLAFLFEGFIYNTRHTLAPTDLAQYRSLRTAPGFEVAALYTF